jgi:DNA-binding CsgD family transcriptional regulator
MNKPLTPRQNEIVNYLRSGMTNKQIGKALGVSPETVKTHIRHIIMRTGLKNRLQICMSTGWNELMQQMKGWRYV